MARRIRLGTFLSAGGEHLAAWRHPDSKLVDRAGFAQYLHAAQVAERALFDLILIGDVGPTGEATPDTVIRNASHDRLDPLPLASALAVTTSHIGLVATGSTSWDQPYHIARRFASIDHLSGGRAGWNCVTSSNQSMARNFNMDKHAAHADRYRRAEEFVDVVKGLWESWDADAFIRDKTSGAYFRWDGMHVLDHRGPHFNVHGPLDVIRSPQGRPVIVQAGSSEPGRALAARVADVVFTTHQTLDSARDFYRDIKARAAQHGRAAGDILVLVALMPVVGRTQTGGAAQAQRAGRAGAPLAGPGPVVASPGRDRSIAVRSKSACSGRSAPRQRHAEPAQPLLDLAARESLTLMQLAGRTAGNRGHWTVTDTAGGIADRIAEWSEGGADGFLLVPPRTPESLEEFADHVVPELQRRGLFRTAYEGRTLRENLGLPQL